MDKAEVKITSGGKDYLTRAVDTFTPVFEDDDVFRYMMCSMPEPERRVYLRTLMSSLVTIAILNGSVIQEANDWSCVALWVPPGRRLDGPISILRGGLVPVMFKLGLGSINRMVIQYQGGSDHYKKKVMGKKKYHYLFIIGTEVRARGQGLASRVIQEYQKKSRQDGLPIWLEASSAHSRDVYARQGFRAVGEVTMGKGKHAATGVKEQGGPGVKFWPMIWDPAEHKEVDRKDSD